MARRPTYIQVSKKNQIRSDHVKGQGDRAYRVFNCLNPECQAFITWPEPLAEDFSIPCQTCGTLHEADGSTKFYDYELVEIDPATKEVKGSVESGEFTVDHFEYVMEATLHKYCIICNTLKPLESFDRHASRETGRQGECRLCKGIYNGIKNQTRIPDQHREAAQKRRLYVDISGESGKIDSGKLFERFEYSCFMCKKKLVDSDGNPLLGEFQIDHTLPAFFLWPASTDTATLLCAAHNSAKAQSWPSEFYNGNKIKELAALTGLDYALLSGEPQFNPSAIEKLKHAEMVDAMYVKYAKYHGELLRLRNRLLTRTGFDFFKSTKKTPAAWIEEADQLLK